MMMYRDKDRTSPMNPQLALRIAIIGGVAVVDGFPAGSGYSWVFAMGAAGAALLGLASLAMPGRRPLS